MISEVIDRLDVTLGKAGNGTLRTVAGAAEYDALKAMPPPARQPAAYAIPLRDVASPNTLAGVAVLRQRIASTFGVFLLVGSLRDARGEASVELLEPVKDAVRRALVGFRPTGDHDPIELRSGDLVSIGEGTLAWQDIFETAITVRFG